MATDQQIVDHRYRVWGYQGAQGKLQLQHYYPTRYITDY